MHYSLGLFIACLLMARAMRQLSSGISFGLPLLTLMDFIDSSGGNIAVAVLTSSGVANTLLSTWCNNCSCASFLRIAYITCCLPWQSRSSIELPSIFSTSSRCTYGDSIVFNLAKFANSNCRVASAPAVKVKRFVDRDRHSTNGRKLPCCTSIRLWHSAITLGLSSNWPLMKPIATRDLSSTNSSCIVVAFFAEHW